MNSLIIFIIGILILFAIFIWSKNNKNKTIKIKPELEPELESELEFSPINFSEKFENLKVNGGTLRFWGNWFGRPMDNYHQIIKTKFNAEKNILLLILDEGEKIKIWNPSKLKLGKTELRIEKADKILFEWNYYGEEKTNENLRFESYIKEGEKIKFETDFRNKPRIANCDLNEPAFSIIGR